MKPKTLLLLKELQKSPFSSDFGKICQSLVALILRENGFNHVVNRLVEGVDIDVSGQLGRFAIEVKTTEGEEVLIGEKDLKGWKDRSQDRYSPVLAALRISLLSEWTLSDASEVPRGVHRILRLRLRQISALTEVVTNAFDAAVQRYIPDLLGLTQQSPLEHLNLLLKKAGVEGTD